MSTNNNGQWISVFENIGLEELKIESLEDIVGVTTPQLTMHPDGDETVMGIVEMIFTSLKKPHPTYPTRWGFEATITTQGEWFGHTVRGFFATSQPEASSSCEMSANWLMPPAEAAA